MFLAIIKDKNNRLPLLSALAIAIMNLLVFYRLILNDPILGWDDKLLLAPLIKLNSIFDYNLLLTYDLQPLRDFSFLFDIFMLRNFEISIFHLHNLFLFWPILFIAYKLLKKIGIPVPAALIIILLFAIHPLHSNIVSWISARKHLLSGLFILLSLLYTFNIRDSITRKDIALVPLFYFLSLISHPIHILMPVWTAYYLYRKGLKGNKYYALLALLFGLALAVGTANLYYYSAVYVKNEGAASLFEPAGAGIFSPVLMFGRYFINLVFPFNLAVYYKKLSFYNFLGLGLFVLWSIFIFIKEKKARHFLLLFFVPLIPGIAKYNQAFTFDTYLFIPTLVFLTINYYPASRIKTNKLAYVFLLLAPLFVYQGGKTSRHWESDITLWKHNYDSQKDASAGRRYLTILLNSTEKQFDVQESLGMIRKLKTYAYRQKGKDQLVFSQIWLNRIYRIKNLELQEKLGLLEKIKTSSYQKSFYKADILFRLNDYEYALININKTIEQEKKSALKLFVSKERISSLRKTICGSIQDESCQNL